MSSTQLRFVTLDVFTDQCFRGNQLAVVDVTGTTLSTKSLQSMAREFNFSETVFLDWRAHPPRARIFTPVNEMAFAGHPVIGTGHVLFKDLFSRQSGGSSQASSEVVAKASHGAIGINAGQVAIYHDPTTDTVAAEIPHNVHIHSRETSRENVLKTQPDLAASDVRDTLDVSYPAVSIVKGVTYVLVNCTALPDLFAKVTAGESPSVALDDGWEPSFAGTMFYIVVKSEKTDAARITSLRVRMIAINLEDPACGSGCCSLGAYLSLRDGSPNGQYRYNFEQGSEMGRDSKLIVDITLDGSGKTIATVRLSGQATLVTEGQMRLPRN